jgi:hypothetical protein
MPAPGNISGSIVSMAKKHDFDLFVAGKTGSFKGIDVRLFVIVF